MKRCYKCKVLKEDDQFYTRDMARKVCVSRCKACMKKDRDSRSTTKKCTKCNKHKDLGEYHKGRADCKICRREYMRDLRANGPKHKTPKRELHTNMYFDKIIDKGVKAQIDNAYHCAQRRARTLANTCAQERAMIRILYRAAQILSNSCGESYQIDHIRPLSKGGTHTFNNLQILSAIENQTKSNKY